MHTHRHARMRTGEGRTGRLLTSGQKQWGNGGPEGEQGPSADVAPVPNPRDAEHRNQLRAAGGEGRRWRPAALTALLP